MVLSADSGFDRYYDLLLWGVFQSPRFSFFAFGKPPIAFVGPEKVKSRSPEVPLFGICFVRVSEDRFVSLKEFDAPGLRRRFRNDPCWWMAQR